MSMIVMDQLLVTIHMLIYCIVSFTVFVCLLGLHYLLAVTCWLIRAVFILCLSANSPLQYILTSFINLHISNHQDKGRGGLR